MAASQTTSTPWLVMDKLLMPRRGIGKRALVAPLGLRRVEAALPAGGFERDAVTVADDLHLRDAIGPDTRLVAIGSGEPAGFGMSSTTMATVTGGEIYPEVMFRRLLDDIRRLIAERAPQAKIVLGGPGAWQVADNPSLQRELGVDHVVKGYCEGNVAELFQGLLAGDEAPAVIEGEPPAVADIPRILGPATMGVVEISRGCGLGCGFCTIAHTAMGHLSVETILADAATNLAAGQSSLCVLSEDLFRYGARGVHCSPETLIDLLTRLREFGGLRLIQADHANIFSIGQYSDSQLAEVSELLVGDTGSRHPWVNVGVETASGTLLKAMGGAPKMGDIAEDAWSDACAEQLLRLCKAGFIPMASLLVGLPEETPEDTERTLQWVRSLAGAPVTIFPVLYAPIGAPETRRRPQLTRLQWQLVRECYEFNFEWMPKLYWDSQTGAGAAWSRRMVFQCLGHGQVWLWRWLLSKHRRRAPE